MKVLGREAGLPPAGANAPEMERAAGDDGKAQGRAEYLSSALTLAPIDLDDPGWVAHGEQCTRPAALPEGGRIREPEAGSKATARRPNGDPAVRQQGSCRFPRHPAKAPSSTGEEPDGIGHLDIGKGTRAVLEYR